LIVRTGPLWRLFLGTVVMSDRIGSALDAGLDVPVSLHPSLPIHRNDWIEAMNAFTYRLTVLHRKLDDEIRRELKRRFPDSMRLLRLKKLRLAVKDRLHSRRLRMERA